MIIIIPLEVCSAYAGLYAAIAVESFDNEHLPASWAWVLFYATNTKSVLFPVMLWSATGRPSKSYITYINIIEVNI